MRVFKYGLRSPTVNADLVWEQLYAAHRYRNTLTKIEIERRTRVREVYSSVVDVALLEMRVIAAQAALKDALAAVQAAKAQTRSARAPAKLRTAAKEARAAAKAAKKALRDARRTLRDDPEVRALVVEATEYAKARVREARAASGVYWGTYLLVETAMDAACKSPLYDGVEPNNPRFLRWRGEGSIGVQVQGGAPVEALAECESTILQFAPGTPPPGADPRSRRSAKRQHHTLRMRVGSDKRAPIWAEWPLILHRPLPAGGRVKRAAVHVRQEAERKIWTLTITVDDAECAYPQGGEGMVAVDVGWRARSGGLRVAMTSEPAELQLPTALLDRLTKPQELRSIRDKKFNKARASLVADLAELDLPEWLREATTTLGRWKSPARLAKLARRWREQPFVGGEAAYKALETWRYDDHHLWRWESHGRRKSLRRRRELYRVWAADLASRFGTLVLEKFDLRKIARRAQAEEEESTQGRANRQLAAVSELRKALVDAFQRTGGTVIEVPAAYTTRRCHGCGDEQVWDQAAELVHRCTACGLMWDQDVNAAKNLLAMGRERSNTLKTTGSARSETETSSKGGNESKWARAARRKGEREARDGAARKRGSKGLELEEES